MKKNQPFLTLVAFTLFGGILAYAGRGPAQTTTAAPKQPNRIAIATENAKQIMLLMDTNKNGRISKAEWMKFMSDEFDRLDADKSGSLDLKELQKSTITVRHVSPEVQGK
jgi:Ca2+-binding EF-hand superfamily protein